MTGFAVFGIVLAFYRMSRAHGRVFWATIGMTAVAMLILVGLVELIESTPLRTGHPLAALGFLFGFIALATVAICIGTVKMARRYGLAPWCASGAEPLGPAALGRVHLTLCDVIDIAKCVLEQACLVSCAEGELHLYLAGLADRVVEADGPDGVTIEPTPQPPHRLP
jgi:hypothetical protein